MTFSNLIIDCRRCLDMTRSSTHCRGDQGDQVNTVTSFLDGSAIYRVTEDMALRWSSNLTHDLHWYATFIFRLRGGSKRQAGKLIGNTHLPHFLPNKFDLNIKSRCDVAMFIDNHQYDKFCLQNFNWNFVNRASDKSTDFVAGDGRAETQVASIIYTVNHKKHPPKSNLVISCVHTKSFLQWT